MRGKKKKKKKKKTTTTTTTTLEKYCRIKVDIECVYLFLLNFKTKYTSQTLIVNHITYKTHKFTTSSLNVKILIVIVTQYKMQAPLLLL